MREDVSLVTLVLSEDRDVVEREGLTGRRVLGRHVGRLVELPTGEWVRIVKIVRYTDILPSPLAFEIDGHELCHAVAALQAIVDPCHADNDGIAQSSTGSARAMRVR